MRNPFRVNNLDHIENQPTGRVYVLAVIACILGVQFKVEGIPFGRAGRRLRSSWTNAVRCSDSVGPAV